MSFEKAQLLPSPSGQPDPRPGPAGRHRRQSRFALPILLGGALLAGALTTSWQLNPASIPLASSGKHSLPGGNTTAVDWAPCPGRENESYLCGFIDVPTDYADPARGSHRLALAKIPARVKAEDCLGVLWINPGGPGGSGVNFVFRFPLDELLEGRYDIIGFDPRGVGASTPAVNCFPTPESYTAFKAHTLLDEGYSIPPAGDKNWTREAFIDQTREMRALKAAEFGLCDAKFGDELWFMGTTSVVKDIERMNSVIAGPDALINFVGFSYGTILGAYLVNVLDPTKIGRVVIDGVASSPEWANEPADLMLYNWLNSTESTYNWFLRDCAAAGAGACALALASDKDPAGKEIERRLEGFLNSLWVTPRTVIMPDGNVGVLHSSIARARLYQSTNGPRSWPAIASLFAKAIFDDDPVPLFQYAHSGIYTGSRQSELSRVAVGCADSPPVKPGDGVSAERMADEMVRVLTEVSPHFGGSVSLIEPDGQCEFWPQRMDPPAGFRFTGPWNAKLKTPMLIIGNTADPITPLTSAREINHLMGNSSRLIIQDSPGHCSLGSVSVCTSGYYKRYLLDGIFPTDTQACAIDDGFFPGADVASLESAWSAKKHELHAVARRASDKWTDWLAEGVEGGER